MSAIVALVTGTLAQVPVSRTTAKGGTMATGSLAVTTSNNEKPVYIGLLAFNDLAETLLQLDKGDAVSVRGRMELNRWVSSEGEAKERWQLVADALLPGPGKPTRARPAPRTAKSPTQAARRFQQPPGPPDLPFDDGVPF